MAASKFFVTVCALLSWAWMGPAIEKVRAAQVAAMMVRIFMGFLLLPTGWPSFFIVSSRGHRAAALIRLRSGRRGGYVPRRSPRSKKAAMINEEGRTARPPRVLTDERE